MRARAPAQLPGAASSAASLFAWLGAEGIDAAAAARRSTASPRRRSHSFAFKGLWHCNWLQAFEVGIDPAHPSFLHRYLHDERWMASATTRPASSSAAASAGEVGGERWPMTRIMREFHQPEISFERGRRRAAAADRAAADDRRAHARARDACRLSRTPS